MASPTVAPELCSEERARLIQEISDAAHIQHVDMATHSIMWLSDIEALQDLLRDAKSGPRGVQAVFSYLSNPLRAMRTLKSWLARPENTEHEIDLECPEAELAPRAAEPTLTPAESSQTPQKRTPEKRKPKGKAQSSNKAPRRSEFSGGQAFSAGEPRSGRQAHSAANLEKRSENAKKAANKRDQGTCIVVKMGEPVEVCHIYPFAMQKKAKQERESFWLLLGVFWSAETIAKWRKHIFGPDGSEVTVNLLCLSQTVHGLWGKGRFALEPVELSEDKTSLTTRFWWLPLRTYSRKKLCLSVAPFLPSDLDAGPFNVKLWDCVTEERIRSGHLLTMTTADPESMPLPAFGLLQMQWSLNRVAAMSGAADVSEEDFEEDFEDDFKGFTSSVLGSLPLDLPERPHRRLAREIPVVSRGENQPLPVRTRESSKVRELAGEASDDAFTFISD
ncbi:hypothetical protein BJX96DRAFT_172203 [Aspergillus floccosus]